jgi:hypothetical protein
VPFGWLRFHAAKIAMQQRISMFENSETCNHNARLLPGRCSVQQKIIPTKKVMQRMPFFMRSVCIDEQIKHNSSILHTQESKLSYQNQAIIHQKSTGHISFGVFNEYTNKPLLLSKNLISDNAHGRKLSTVLD